MNPVYCLILRAEFVTPVRQQKGYKLTTTFNQKDGKAVLAMLGDIDPIELKAMLVQAFATGKAIRVDLSAAETLDVAALQLLWASARQAAKTGLAFTVVRPLPEAIQSSVRNAGFDDFPVGMEPELPITVMDRLDRAE